MQTQYWDLIGGRTIALLRRENIDHGLTAERQVQIS